ncbi:MAG: PqiC family protein [Cognaticolwellia sp.]|jgi:uncharacterized lipoprotein YmbA
MKQALIIFGLSIILMTGCSSDNTPKTQYYLLNSPTLDSSGIIGDDNNPIITVQIEELPDYLKQPSLVLQLSDHQLHYSNFHMWAEPLQVSIARSLTQDLNTIDNSHNYIIMTAPNTKKAKTAVVIDVIAFHATHHSKAILTGNYWLQQKNSKNSLQKHHFKFTVALDLDGYPHAVEQMRKAVTQLANEITESINQ